MAPDVELKVETLEPAITPDWGPVHGDDESWARRQAAARCDARRFYEREGFYVAFVTLARD